MPFLDRFYDIGDIWGWFIIGLFNFAKLLQVSTNLVDAEQVAAFWSELHTRSSVINVMTWWRTVKPPNHTPYHLMLCLCTPSKVWNCACKNPHLEYLDISHFRLGFEHVSFCKQYTSNLIYAPPRSVIGRFEVKPSYGILSKQGFKFKEGLRVYIHSITSRYLVTYYRSRSSPMFIPHIYSQNHCLNPPVHDG